MCENIPFNCKLVLRDNKNANWEQLGNILTKCKTKSVYGDLYTKQEIYFNFSTPFWEIRTINYCGEFVSEQANL